MGSASRGERRRNSAATNRSHKSGNQRWIVAATCTTEGQEVYECTKCGEEKTVQIKKADHDMELFKAKPATCTESGHLSYGICKNCGYRFLWEEVPALGHDYGENGLCTRCGGVGTYAKNNELPYLGDIDTYRESRMIMMPGASLDKNGDGVNQIMRFSCNVDSEFLAEVKADENKALAMLVVQMRYLDELNLNHRCYFDFITELNAGNMECTLSIFNKYEIEDSTTGSVALNYNFLVSKEYYNCPFVAIGVMIDNTSGVPKYKYAAMPSGLTYRTNARSVAEVASSVLNAYTFGQEVLTNEQLANMRNCVSLAVDYTRGVENPTTDEFHNATVTVINDNAITIAENGTSSLKWLFTPYERYFYLGIRFLSEDSGVATVTTNGEIKGISLGTTVVKLYVAGEEVGRITVTVEK